MKKITTEDLFWLIMLIIMLGMFYAYMINSNYVIVSIIWKYTKIPQMYILFLIEESINECIDLLKYIHISLVHVNYGFEYGFFKLVNTDVHNISPNFIHLFDLYFSDKIRFFISPLFFYIGYKNIILRKKPTKTYTFESLLKNASKSYPHLRRLVEANLIDKILATIPLKRFNRHREYLKGENPLKYSHEYDFEKRDSYTNRYSMGLSQTEILTANPPIGVTNKEIEEDRKYQKEFGYSSNFRPICYFYLDGKREEHSIDFCERTATITLERILMNRVDINSIDDSDKLGRCFDTNGDLIDLEYFDDSVSDKKLKSGFRETNLLNNGNEYFGTEDNVRLLFNELENRVLDEIEKIVGYNNNISFNKVIYALVKKNHAFSTTLIWRLVILLKTKNKSRITGTQLNWVKREDRYLGLVLHSIGRETPFCEVSGIYSHYLLEVKYGGRLTEPFVLKAVQDLYEKAKKILESGKSEENIFDMSEEEYNSIYKDRFDTESDITEYKDILDDIEDL